MQAVFLRPLPHVLEEMDWPVSGSPRASPSPLRLLIPPREEGEDEDESERRTTMSESLDGEADERSVGGKGKGRMTSKAKRRDLPPPSPHSMHERERLKIGPNTDMLGVRWGHCSKHTGLDAWGGITRSLFGAESQSLSHAPFAVVQA